MRRGCALWAVLPAPIHRDIIARAFNRQKGRRIPLFKTEESRLVSLYLQLFSVNAPLFQRKNNVSASSGCAMNIAAGIRCDDGVRQE